jgi:transposase
VVLEYGGDDPNKNRMVSWFQMQLRAIGTCLDADLPEACLALIYSGIDTFGLLAAPAAVLDSTRDTFKRWCEKYILPRIWSVEGTTITSVDLYAARCGILHTSTPLSKLERAGEAHQIWYRYGDKAGLNLIMNTRLPPLGLDIQSLAVAFKEGGIACIADINQDVAAFQAADARAQHFLRWGKHVA